MACNQHRYSWALRGSARCFRSTLRIYFAVSFAFLNPQVRLTAITPFAAARVVHHVIRFAVLYFVRYPISPVPPRHPRPTSDPANPAWFAPNLCIRFVMYVYVATYTDLIKFKVEKQNKKKCENLRFSFKLPNRKKIHYELRNIMICNTVLYDCSVYW